MDVGFQALDDRPPRSRYNINGSYNAWCVGQRIACPQILKTNTKGDRDFDGGTYDAQGSGHGEITLGLERSTEFWW